MQDFYHQQYHGHKGQAGNAIIGAHEQNEHLKGDPWKGISWFRKLWGATSSLRPRESFWGVLVYGYPLYGAPFRIPEANVQRERPKYRYSLIIIYIICLYTKYKSIYMYVYIYINIWYIYR